MHDVPCAQITETIITQPAHVVMDWKAVQKSRLGSRLLPKPSSTSDTGQNGVKKPLKFQRLFHVLAEEVRFELTDPCESTVFKTVAIDHSATLPVCSNCAQRPSTLGLRSAVF